MSVTYSRLPISKPTAGPVSNVRDTVLTRPATAAGHTGFVMTSIQLTDVREALEEAVVDEGRVFVDPLSESRAARPNAHEDRQWIPVDVVNRVIDELATATVGRVSQARSAARFAPNRRDPDPEGLRQVLELLETLPTAGRTAAEFRDDLDVTLKKWRVRARNGKQHYWTNLGC